ncbi:LysR family transcriptional regulator [Pararhodobacter sp. SW119]|uniref:LysR family transcriptional regulator n=1 Tax=Pararhodobacter sp. SW119 TaxID=2780075 RepID=UPI001ADF4769
MQIELLETFLTLCETRSFRKTAERLRLAQPTVTARLRSLERQLCVQLFMRSRAGTEPTTEGLKFESHARVLLAEWHRGVRAVRGSGNRALMLRIGLQHDLVGSGLGDWIAAFRAALPDCGFYIETDYSPQMCADVLSGFKDFAVLFTPRPHPDLHFVTLGALRYRMVSSHARRLEEVDPERYIHGNYAPAITSEHERLLPALSAPPLVAGQNATVAEMLTAIGGSAYLTEATAAALVAAGQVQEVADAPPLSQPVHAAMALRLRTSRMQSQLLRLVRQRIGGG